MFNWIGADTEKRKNGTWVEHDGNKFLIASPSSLEAQRWIEKETDKLEKDDDGNIKGSDSFELGMRAIVALKLLDWDVSYDGNEIEYTPDNAFNALVNDPEFLKWVNDQSADIGNYRKEKRAKKSKK